MRNHQETFNLLANIVKFYPLSGQLEKVISSYVFAYSMQNREVDPNAMALSVKIGEILIAAGCDPTIQANNGKTPTMLAIEQVCKS